MWLTVCTVVRYLQTGDCAPPQPLCRRHGCGEGFSLPVVALPPLLAKGSNRPKSWLLVFPPAPDCVRPPLPGWSSRKNRDYCHGYNHIAQRLTYSFLQSQQEVPGVGNAATVGVFGAPGRWVATTGTDQQSEGEEVSEERRGMGRSDEDGRSEECGVHGD
ncbi:hypothetical protein BXZ70DRAFT_1058311 [Cristinia sonorae]|uniref:Uncharacterized protein n=1 Tax=Cristinia sonorae TaxID=1940300 RepID=A0A8K0XRY8_9AGAR|nr:hypothetical protein BXZ70DRAFT_1058311 [Cristinia sonorae]